jgi:predicted transposase/invertase (TIGR01784 family)
MAFSEAFLTWEQETKDRGLQEGLQAGLQAGRQEGLQAGKQEERVEIAKNLLRQGLQAEAITQATGLTVAQLQDLQGQLG